MKRGASVALSLCTTARPLHTRTRLLKRRCDRTLGRARAHGKEHPALGPHPIWHEPRRPGVLADHDHDHHGDGGDRGGGGGGGRGLGGSYA
jgi:hypothetical protein